MIERRRENIAQSNEYLGEFGIKAISLFCLCHWMFPQKIF